MVITRIPAAQSPEAPHSSWGQGRCQGRLSENQGFPQGHARKLRKIVASSWFMGFHYFLLDSTLVFITIVRGHIYIYIHAHTYIYIHADIELYSHVLYASAMSGGIIIQASAFWSLRCCHEVDSGFHVAPRLSENPKFEKLPHRFKLASPGIARSTFKERSEWTNLRYAKSLFQFFFGT